MATKTWEGETTDVSVIEYGNILFASIDSI